MAIDPKDLIQGAGGVGGGIGDLIGSLIGEAEAKGDEAEADRLRRLAMSQVYGMRTDAPVVSQGASQMAGVQADPMVRAAQSEALQGIGREYQQGGMTPEDRLAYADMNDELGQRSAGAQGALDNRMAMRGGMNSGLAYAGSLVNEQNQASNANRQGLGIAADARKRALGALGQYGTMAGQMRSQQFGEGAMKANSQDAINRFNAQNTQSQMNRSVDLENNKIGAQYDATQTGADQAWDRGQRKRKRDTAIGQGIGGVAGTAAGIIGAA